MKIVSNKIPGINIDISPNKTSVPPQGTATALLSITAEDEVTPRPYTISLNTEIILKNTIGNVLSHKEFDDTRPAHITKNYDFTINVMEPLNFNDHMIKIIDNWVDPLTGTYATLVTIITGVLGWRIWRKQRKET